MTTDSAGALVEGVSVTAGQKLFMLALMVCSALIAVGFSLALFGAASSHLATVTDRLYVVAIGTGLMVLGGAAGYWTLH